MPTDTTTATDLMKRVYTDGVIANLQNMEAETFPQMKKSSRKVGGEGFFGPAHVQGNQRGQGSQNENESLRETGTQVVKQWKIYPTVFTHKIRYSGLAMAMATGNESSFADILTFNNDNGFKDSTKELNAQCFRDGRGRIAQVNGAVASSTTVNFDNGVPTHFREGMFVDMVNAGGTKQINSIEVVDIDVGAKTITLASAQSCDDDSWIYREDTNDNAPTTGKELSGYPAVSDDGSIFATFENIIRNGAGASPKWRGLTLTMTGQNISNDSLLRMLFRLKVLSGTKAKMVRSNTSQFRKYLDLVIPTIRTTPEGKMDTMSREVPTWNGMPWTIETDCGFGDIYLEDDDYIQKYEVFPLRLDQTDGKILKWDNNFDGFISYIKSYVQTGTENPRKGIRATALNEPTF